MRVIGKVYTTSDGYKYINSKINEKYIYLKCTIFRSGCKGTGRLNRETDLITPLSQHDHNIEEYKSDVFDLKTKCKTTAMHSQTNLRLKFLMIQQEVIPVRVKLHLTSANQPCIVRGEICNQKFPDAFKFCEMLCTTSFGKYFPGSVNCGTDTAAIFYSDTMSSAEVIHSQFEGTFFTVPIQFAQLWTIFVAIGRHSLPAIHCLMTAKNQELYTAVLEKIQSKIPLFKAVASMSDWEPAPRNAIKEVNATALMHFAEKFFPPIFIFIPFLDSIDSRLSISSHFVAYLYFYSLKWVIYHLRIMISAEYAWGETSVGQGRKFI